MNIFSRVRATLRALQVLLIAGIFCGAQAQSLQPVFQGKVLDSSGAPIAGAQITAAKDGGNPTVKTVSNENGDFVIALEPAAYRLKISAEGFSELSQTVQIPQAGEPSDFVLQVAPLREMVTVTESARDQVTAISTATKTLTPLRDIPQSIAVVTQEQVRDQLMTSIGDVVRYIPGITAIQGENNRDQVVIRGNSSSADFFVNGVRDDVQYYRDLYNVERLEALKGPNAMIFGRGGGGGVINRVTKDAGFSPLREFVLQTGSFNNRRIALDYDRPLSGRFAVRLNGMFEDSSTFRDYVDLKRYGVSPSLTFAPAAKTRITLGYENFHDFRTADRGIPSFQGKPADIDVATFFGNPDDSHVRASVNLASVSVDHQIGALTIRNRAQFGDYDRWYQNFVPGALTADKTQVALSAYNNSTQRRNTFDQTDLTYHAATGGIQHTLLGGFEFGRQITDNLRHSGFFNNSAVSILAPYAAPTIHVPVTFRASATDADNHLRTSVAAAYLQDQIELSKHVQVVSGVRMDRFDLNYHNNRTDENLRRLDKLVSPRVGIVVKPIVPFSLYGNYSVSYLPSSGDQFSSLTTITQQAKPEKFTNYEMGIKWDLDRGLALTAAVYRLDRTNTRATDPDNPSRILQTGRQRTNGFEVGWTGRVAERWRMSGGYAYQDAFIVSATTAARAGAQVAQVPHHSFSLWNNYQLHPRLGAGLGILHRSDMFAAIDNTVTLPAYTRADAGVFFSFTERLRLQMNVENMFDKRYYINADGNNNISPGSSRAVRIGFTGRF